MLYHDHISFVWTTVRQVLSSFLQVVNRLFQICSKNFKHDRSNRKFGRSLTDVHDRLLFWALLSDLWSDLNNTRMSYFGCWSICRGVHKSDFTKSIPTWKLVIVSWLLYLYYQTIYTFLRKAIDNLNNRLTFDLGKKNKIFYYNWKRILRLVELHSWWRNVVKYGKYGLNKFALSLH